ncbi:MAG: hypothetical protein ACRECO_15130 [Xanthobacteraceae bacterium]
MAAMRLFRRPIALIAVGFVVLQSLLAALAMAQAAAHAVPGSFDAGIICRSDGQFDTNPEGAKAAHLCCAVCSICAPAIEPSRIVAGAPSFARVSASFPVAGGDIVTIPRRAIRAGPSQGPPSLFEHG